MQATAKVSRDGEGMWLIYVPEVDAYTQARAADEIESMARDLVAVLREIEPAEVVVRLEMAGEPQGSLGEDDVLVPVPADELERDYAAGVVPRPPERTEADRQRIADDVAAAKRDAGFVEGPPFAAELAVDGPPTPLVLDPAQPWIVTVTMATAQPVPEDGLVAMDARAEELHDATVAARANAPGFVLTAEVGGAEVGDVVRWAVELAEGVVASAWLVALHVRTLGEYEADALREDPASAVTTTTPPPTREPLGAARGTGAWPPGCAPGDVPAARR